MTNLDRYKRDLDALIKLGDRLHLSMQRDCFPEEVERQLQDKLGEKAVTLIKELPSFVKDYQSWYSEAKVLIKQLLPDRLADFVRHYEKPKPRKEISYDSYRVEDYLQGLNVSTGWKEKIVAPDAAIPQFRQQLSILKSVKARF